jgi:hypothetical protein
MSRVFVIQSTRHQADVTPAEAYGDVEFILTPGDRTSLNPDLVMAKLCKGLKEFKPDEDYILWSGGDPLSFMLTGWCLSQLGVKKFRYLRYEKPDVRRGKSAPFYIPVTVTPA